MNFKLSQLSKHYKLPTNQFKCQVCNYVNCKYPCWLFSPQLLLREQMCIIHSHQSHLPKVSGVQFTLEQQGKQLIVSLSLNEKHVVQKQKWEVNGRKKEKGRENWATKTHIWEET